MTTLILRPLAILLIILFLSACVPATPQTLPTVTQTPVPTFTPEATPTMTQSSANPYHIIAYFPEWGIDRPFTAKNLISTGAAEKITIINYAFGIPGPDENGDVVCTIWDADAAYGRTFTGEMSVDGVADDPSQPLRGHFNQLRKLKALYPQIKIVVSLGGWTGSGWFSDAVRTQESREKFVASCIDLYVRGNLPVANGAGGEGAGAGVFDGIDLDWEYPVRGGLPENHTYPDDAANYVLLLQEFRKQYEAAGRTDFLLTMAGPGPGQAAQYNLDEAHPLLDLVAIMTYDMRGAWSESTGHHTNLCKPTNGLSADETVRLYRDSYGVPGEKLLVGAGFYGHGWKNVAPENNGLYQQGEHVSEGGSYYYQLVEKINAGYTRYWDEQALAPYLYSESERTFWSFDDPQSLELKARYARRYGLAGIMFWDIMGDDTQGTLVDTIYRELISEEAADDPCAATGTTAAP